MLREEAVELLEKEKAYMIGHGGDRQAKALDSAIKALKQQDRILQILDDYDLETWEILEKIKEVVRVNVTSVS